jgi:diguanylate cyclase (GGDEF)-like protein
VALSCASDGSLWTTGEQDGVWRLTPRGDRLQAVRLPISPELQSLAPLAILADRRGWVWLGTDLGVLVWNGHEWRHLSQESGLIWNDIDQSALAEDPDGSLWIGTSGGLSHLLHPEHVFDPQPLSISVTDMERGSQALGVGKKLVLPWAPLPLSIQISSPMMRNRSGLVFEYQMKGFDHGWIECQNGEAVFSGLPPGAYTFSARAVNSDLNAASESLEMQISVLSPWWRTWWMLALYVFGLAGLLWGLHRLYENHLVARGKELEALVSERTRELEASRAQLRMQASHDELTGMLNRKAILAALSIEMKRAVRDSMTIAVALVDLDHFKQINDVCGHLAGDEALRLFADAVRKAIRSYDHAGRYGGEEFLLVLSRIPRAEVKSRLIKLQGLISNLPFHWQDKEFKINCSAGVAVYSFSNSLCTMEALLSAADQSLYLAKASGRNRVVFSDARWPLGKVDHPREHRVSAS